MDAAARVIAGACCAGNLDDIGPPTMKTSKGKDNDDIWNALDRLDMDFNVVDDDDRDDCKSDDDIAPPPSSEKSLDENQPNKTSAPPLSRRTLFSGMRNNNNNNNNSSSNKTSSSPYEAMTSSVALRVEQRKEVYSKFYMPDSHEVEEMEQLAKRLSLHGGGGGGEPASLLNLMSIWGGGSGGTNNNNNNSATSGRQPQVQLEDADDTDPAVLKRARDEFSSFSSHFSTLLDSPGRQRRREQRTQPNIVLARGGPVLFVTTHNNDDHTETATTHDDEEGGMTRTTTTTFTHVYEQEGQVVVLTNAVLLVSHTKPFLRGTLQIATTTTMKTPTDRDEGNTELKQGANDQSDKPQDATPNDTFQKESTATLNGDSHKNADEEETANAREAINNNNDDEDEKKEPEDKGAKREGDKQLQANHTSRRFTPKRLFRKMAAKAPSSSKLAVPPLQEEQEEGGEDNDNDGDHQGEPEPDVEKSPETETETVIRQWIPHDLNSNAARRGANKRKQRQRVKILACLEWRAITALQNLTLFAPVEFLQGERSLVLQEGPHLKHDGVQSLWRLECPTTQELDAWIQVFSTAIIQNQLHQQQEEQRLHAAAMADKEGEEDDGNDENKEKDHNDNDAPPSPPSSPPRSPSPPSPLPPKSLGWQHEILQTTLFSAAVCNNVTMIQQYKGGAAVNDQDDENGKTALHYATLRQHAAAMDAILKLPHANPNAKDQDGHAALYYVDADKQGDLVQLLVSHGADKSELSKDSKSELFGAATSRFPFSRGSPKKTSKAAAASAEATSSTMSETMSALKERGERIEKLHNRGATLQEDAANFREMARQMKEKAKKQNSGGLFGAFRG